jgi:hypothetical protein
MRLFLFSSLIGAFIGGFPGAFLAFFIAAVVGSGEVGESNPGKGEESSWGNGIGCCFRTSFWNPWLLLARYCD